MPVPASALPEFSASGFEAWLQALCSPGAADCGDTQLLGRGMTESGVLGKAAGKPAGKSSSLGKLHKPQEEDSAASAAVCLLPFGPPAAGQVPTMWDPTGEPESVAVELDCVRLGNAKMLSLPDCLATGRGVGKTPLPQAGISPANPTPENDAAQEGLAGQPASHSPDVQDPGVMLSSPADESCGKDPARSGEWSLATGGHRKQSKLRENLGEGGSFPEVASRNATLQQSTASGTVKAPSGIDKLHQVQVFTAETVRQQQEGAVAQDSALTGERQPENFGTGSATAGKSRGPQHPPESSQREPREQPALSVPNAEGISGVGDFRDFARDSSWGDNSGSEPSRPQVVPAAIGGGGDVARGQPLHTAHLVESLCGSEVRIGVKTEAFGTIHIRTALTDDRVTAVVGTEHEALHAALRVEAPMLENAMNRHQLQLEALSLDAGPSGAGSSGQGHQRGTDSSPPQEPPPRWEGGTTAMARLSRARGAETVHFVNTDRLDVQA